MHESQTFRFGDLTIVLYPDSFPEVVLQNAKTYQP